MTAERARRLLFGFYFFASGAAGLIYQVVWTRQAGLVFGNTTVAIGTVVAVFMGGLALGSALSGSWTTRQDHRPERLLRAYALLEGAIGLCGVAIPWLFALAEPIYRLSYRWIDSAPALFDLTRVGVAALIFLVPATLMGATLPILAHYFSRESSSTARTVARLYALNTLGATVGAAAAGLFLVPQFGLHIATLTAASLNLAVAIAAWLTARPAQTTPAPQSPSTAPNPSSSRLILLLFACSGFTALFYEIAWTRALTLTIGSTTYAFTLILIAFIGGLAGGAALISRYADRLPHAGGLFAFLQLLIGVAALGMFLFLRKLPETLVTVYASSLKDQFILLKLVEFGFMALVVTIPTLLMGALFPTACRLVETTPSSAGLVVGRLYAWNTVGCILGSLVASFIAIPMIGLDLCLRAGTALSFLIATAASLLLIRRHRAIILGGGMALLGGTFLVPAWDVRSMSFGSYIYGQDIDEQFRRYGVDVSTQMYNQPEPLFADWDSYALVTVHRYSEGQLSLRINGKVDASTGMADQATQILSAHIPLLMHPNPKRVLVVGLGSGITLANVLTHPEPTAECVELSPAVVRAATTFTDANEGVLRRTDRARVRVNDARTHLQYTKEQYDVIISEPSNLWLSGMATLFTREYFATARGRLSAGGMMAQWLHGYRLSVHDFRAIVRTFTEIFPDAMLWETQPAGDYLLVGWTTPPTLDLEQMRKRLARVPRSPVRTECGLDDAVSVLGSFVTGGTALRSLGGEGPLITDDHCWIEFTAPRSLHRDERLPLVQLLGSVRGLPQGLLTGADEEAEGAIAQRLRARRLVAWAAVVPFVPDTAERIARCLDEALTAAPTDPYVVRISDQHVAIAFDLSNQARALGRLGDALSALQAVPEHHSRSIEAYALQGDILTLGLRLEDAKERYRRAWRRAPGHAHAGTKLADLLIREDKSKEALDLLAVVLKEHPTYVEARVTHARALWQDGQPDAARAELNDILSQHPDNASARELKREWSK